MGDPPFAPPELDGAWLPRLRYLIWVESLINIGCKFRPTDLPAQIWDQLVTLAMERQFLDRLVDERREKQQQVEKELNKARTATGIPPPGGTVFPHKRPFR